MAGLFDWSNSLPLMLRDDHSCHQVDREVNTVFTKWTEIVTKYTDVAKQKHVTTVVANYTER